MRRSNFGKAIWYGLLLCMFCLVAAYQLRISLDTVHYQTRLDFYVPFLVEPFTNRMYGGGYYFRGQDLETQSDIDRTLGAAELISVNGQPFRGLSLYLRELFRVRHPWPEPSNKRWVPFTVAVQTGDSRIHDVLVTFGHCTCGVPGAFEAAAYWVGPQMFCVLLGFAVVFLRPKALLSWALLGLVLSLSQLQLLPEWYSGYQETASPMVWAGWPRVPAVAYRSFVQHAWPGALLLASAHFYRSKRKAHRAALCLAAAFFVLAVIKALLEVSWSEDYRPLVWVYRLMEQYRTELMIAALAGVAILAWSLNRRVGVAVAAFGLLATGALYREPPLIVHGQRNPHSGDVLPFPAMLLAVHNTPGFIALLFTAGCLLAGLVVVRRRVSLVEAASLMLCVPLVVFIAGIFGNYWWLYSPVLVPYLPGFILVSAGFGLVGIGWSVIRRTAAEPESGVLR